MNPSTVLPTGTVTFLFTDIEGSTKLWEQYPEAMKPALAKHDGILRRAVETNGGHIVKTTGDGIHAVFGTVAAGINAAFVAQQALQAEPWDEIRPQSVRVRMGLHTGEAETRAGDYYGGATNRAARLMSIGYGGQILVSNATAELIREKLPANTTLRDLGECRLKDLTRPERVYQLVHPSLPAAYPPIRTLDAIPNNLPVQLTSFIGREQEIAEINRLLHAARLVTLTGSGGTGKTRLAQAVSAQVLEEFPQGVWLIELAPLTGPSLIIPALAQVFGLKEMPYASLDAVVMDYLREKNALLILDNCEHLIEACAHLADDLLRHCAHIKMITSSRESLGIDGEVVYRIPSMAGNEAVRLFVERAQAANPKFHLTEANMLPVTQICSRLDGIPLAIELAAARVRLLSPEQIAARLNDRFRLLIGGSRTALPRQQTLRALIDWSYDLLSEQEKHLLRIASVFAGSWRLEALEAVSQDLAAMEHLELLVNKSLVQVEEIAHEMRYSLLETIRQYAREKLMDAGIDRSIQARNRHLEFYVELAETAEPRLSGPEMIECMDELDVEQDNLRAAMEWALENDPKSALRMAGILPDFWGRRLSASEAYHWLMTALALSSEPEAPNPGDLKIRARAYFAAAALAFTSGDNLSAQDAIERTVSIARQIDETKILAGALVLGATIYGFLGNIVDGLAWAEEARALCRQYGYAFEGAVLAGQVLFVSALTNQPISLAQTEEAIRIARKSNNPWVMAIAIMNVGRAEVYSGRFTEASAYFQEGFALFEKMRDKAMQTACRSELGHMFRQQGRFAEAAEIYRETIRSFQELGHRPAVAHELECLAFIAVAQEQYERAAKILGGAEALRAALNTDMSMIEHREYDQIVAALRAQKDPASLEKAWLEGRAMTMEQTIQFALKE